MKKIILMLALFCAVVSANAQIATENSKTFDNVYVTLNGGVATPLSFKNVFPVNPTFGLALGKELTPVFAIEAEGTAWLGSHVEIPVGDDIVVNRFGFNDNGNFNAIRGLYVGMNGIVNLTNLFLDYKGSPRTVELSAVAGTGWEHIFTPNASDKAKNGLGVKTGLNLDFNFGKTKAHTVSVKPAVLWNVVTFGEMPLQFNRNHAQLYLGLGYTYHFKTSNGTRHFKTYDVGAMQTEINILREELAKKPTEVVREVVKETVTTKVVDGAEHVVYFAQNSDVLTNEAKAVLDNVTGRVKVNAYASPEGTDGYNKELSQRRANAVADYLRSKNVTVTEIVGRGVVGETSNRVAVVTVE
jgi:outer membrane protein OmpA-like peptidoglycan-associated protein